MPRDSHACYLVELPTPPGAARGVRIIFDPVFSERWCPSQWLGFARFTGKTLAPDATSPFLFRHLTPPLDAPCKVEDIPAVDAIVLSVCCSSLWAIQTPHDSDAAVSIITMISAYIPSSLS
jgi:hypothetical protein